MILLFGVVMILGVSGSPFIKSDLAVEEKVERLTEKWLETQERTILQLQKELHDEEMLKEFSQKCDVLSDEFIQKPQTRADFAWKSAQDTFIARTKWTFPFDDTLTCRDIEGFFINASDLELEGQKYIASQAPLTTTLSDFWKMIIHTKSTTIVALNMPEEDKDEPEPRPVEYWKQNCLQGLVAIDNWTIVCVGQEVVAKEEGTDFAIIKRTFELKNSQSHVVRQIIQFHFQNWPDFEGVPNERLFKKLLELVEASHTAKDIPLTVHCAAGMGRAGSFIAAHSMRRKIHSDLQAGKCREEIKVNLAKTIFSMRQCRKDMVSDKGMPCIANVL